MFVDDAGAPLAIKEARSRYSGLFAVHEAVRDTYARILKNHKKDQKEHGGSRRRVSGILPGTMEALCRLVRNQKANRDVNTMIRLGKAIHYRAAAGGEDCPGAVLVDWPADVADSWYWTSDGQAAIKRNEAFVRVWRHTLAWARLSATDWADPGGRQSKDILGANVISNVTDPHSFDRAAYDRKVDLLFGGRADLFRGTDNEFTRAVLRFALKSLANLRHATFHFKGLGHFTAVLRDKLPAPEDAPGGVTDAVDELWRQDREAHAEQLRATMRGAHFDLFFDTDDMTRLNDVLADSKTEILALPRFARILHRAETAWQKGADRLPLPSTANRRALETPARLCQYTALKLVYERSFRRWLMARDSATLNRYIARASARSTKAARDINPARDEDQRKIIVSRAEKLGALGTDANIETFFFGLSAETASEMRVQRGYVSDPENAREQAGYIEDLKCDVVAQAFCDYLAESDLDFVLTMSAETRPADAPRCDLDALSLSEGEDDAEPWQRSMYFLLHLAPVDAAGRLLHQVRKWRILAGREIFSDSPSDDRVSNERARRLVMVLELYLDMHDAKFEGGTALVRTEPFAALFESEDAFTRIFPPSPSDAQERRVPKRGLREIMRFGHLPGLKSVFEKHPVPTQEVLTFFETDDGPNGGADGVAPIAEWQDRREELHAKWVKDRKHLSADDLRSYVETLARIVEHRHRAARVTLTDHVRLHRLLMGVLGRLVDYAGLWERDLYFVTVAAMHEAGETPAEAFESKGHERLGEGRVVDALRNCRSDAVKDAVSGAFGPVWENGERTVGIRNGFAHFNILRAADGGTSIDLTECVNDARDLMAYDRKLRNAVTRSVKEHLSREGLSLEWTTDSSHRLGSATLATRQATHLGGHRLVPADMPANTKHRGPKGIVIGESFHGAGYLSMVAALFGDATVESRRDVAGLKPEEIDWAASARPGRPPRKKQSKKQANQKSRRQKYPPGKPGSS